MRFTFSRFGFVCPDVCTTAAFCRVSPQEKEEEEGKKLLFYSFFLKWKADEQGFYYHEASHPVDGWVLIHATCDGENRKGENFQGTGSTAQQQQQQQTNELKAKRPNRRFCFKPLGNHHFSLRHARVSLVTCIPSSLLLIQVNGGGHHLSSEDTLNNKLFSLFFFFVLLSLSPLNLFVFATAKINRNPRSLPSEAHVMV